MRGATLLAALEYTLSDLSNDELLLQVSGMRYQYDQFAPPGRRVVGISIDNERLDPDASYSVATNEFVALYFDALGLPCENRRIIEDTTEFQVFAEYLAAMGTVSAASEGRIAAVGPLIGVGVPDAPAGRAPSLGLAAHPNPAGEQMLLTYTTFRAAPTRVALYDVMGRHLRTLVDASLEAGEHTVAVDARDLPSGTYVVRMASGEAVEAMVVRVGR